jgi:hypothetical protein
MSKLLQRLSDAAKSGVYKCSRSDEILAATRGSGLHVARIDLAGAAGKDAALKRFAEALSFPGWFGGNWDALEDSLGDLSLLAADGHVLLIQGAQGLLAPDREPLLDILGASAASWAGRGKPFFAVFLGGEDPLPDLYNDRR